MLRLMVERQIIVIALGIFTGVGILSKCMVNAVLARLVRAAGNMSKSTHPFMRLLRAKFEHACMVSETVENVEVFVDKYLYNYKVFGIRLHSLRRLEKASALLCIVTGVLGAFFTYQVYGMNDLVLQTGAIGAGLGILVYVFHLTTDENYRVKMARNYMVDYLQNVCLRRYEKAYQKELSEKAAGVQMAEAAAAEGTMAEEEYEEADMENVSGAESAKEQKPEPVLREEILPEQKSGQRALNAAALKEEAPISLKQALAEPELRIVPERKEEKSEFEEKKESLEGTQQQFVEKEIRIRQILEEFMA